MELTPRPEKVPETQPAFSGGPPGPPPKPPKQTARDLMEPDEPGRRIWVGDYIEVRELAEHLGLKPFQVVADLMEFRVFKHYDDIIEFATAARIAQKHGFVIERIL